MARAARRAVDSAVMAVGLLTVVPVRTGSHSGGLGIAAPWFPAVGALLGAGAAGIHLAADGPLGPSVSAVLAVGWLIVMTGALHTDGLADCADALGVRGGREQRLAVMRQSTIGVFGTVAMVIYVLLLAGAIAGLRDADALGTLVVVGAVSRWSAVAHAVLLAPARRDGLGAAFTVSPVAATIATVVSALTAAWVLGGDGLVGLAASVVVVTATTVWARAALGGRTGDTLGASVAVTEVVLAVLLLGLAND